MIVQCMIIQTYFCRRKDVDIPFDKFYMQEIVHREMPCVKSWDHENMDYRYEMITDINNVTCMECINTKFHESLKLYVVHENSTLDAGKRKT